MTSREFRERLARRAKRSSVRLAPELESGLEAYYRLLETWNARVNLTALDLVGGPDATIDRLLIEPLVAARHLPASARMIDIGSGGGSPAIPMKLCRPDTVLTLVEAKTRKSAFLREAGRHLRIDLLVETARYEALLSRPDLHEAFDVGTVRAVRTDARLLRGLQAFLRPGGALFLFGGPSPAAVPSAIVPPLFWRSTHTLLESDRSRLVILEKAVVGAAQQEGSGRGMFHVEQ